MPTNGDVLTYNSAADDLTEWQTLGAGSGDMTKATYDANNDGKVNSADTADAVAWSGVTGKPSTFTPSTHTHTLADITDAGTAAHTHAASDITSGVLDAARIALTNSVGTLGGDIAMTNQNTRYGTASVTVGAGTWLLLAYVTVGRSATTLARYTGRIYNGSAAVASGQMTQPSQNPHWVTIPMFAVETVVSSTTYTAQAAATLAGCTMKAAANDNGQGNNATRIIAVRIA